MALETKVILRMLVTSIGKAKTVKEAYEIVAEAANVEGLDVPSFEEFRKKYEAEAGA